MAWIELHDTLSEHPKTERLAEALNINQGWAVGILACLWTWAIRNAADGDLSRVSEKAIARACFWAGAPEELAGALRACGWLEEDGTLHDWRDYAGRLLARREANAQRMRLARARSCGARAGATEPYPTEPDQTEHTHEIGADAAWRNSARARGAVAQRVVDRLTGQGCTGARLYDVVLEYLEAGLTPERIADVCDADEARLSALLFERLVEGGAIL